MVKYLRKKNNQKGFTLAEMLIVVAIISVLVAISVPVFTDKLEKARETTDVANMRSAKSAAMIKYLDGELNLGEFGGIYYYSASEGVLKEEAGDALPAYGQGSGTIDGGIRFDNYNETGADGSLDGTDAKGKILQVIIDMDEADDGQFRVRLEWVEE